MDLTYLEIIEELKKYQNVQPKKKLSNYLEKKTQDANTFLLQNNLPELEVILLKKEFQLILENRVNEGITIGEFNFTFRERMKLEESIERYANGRNFILNKSASNPGTSSIPKPISPIQEDEISLHPREEELITSSPKNTPERSQEASESSSSSSSSESNSSSSESEDEDRKAKKEEKKRKKKMKKKQTEERIKNKILEELMASTTKKDNEKQHQQEESKKERDKIPTSSILKKNNVTFKQERTRAKSLAPDDRVQESKSRWDPKIKNNHLKFNRKPYQKQERNVSDDAVNKEIRCLQYECRRIAKSEEWVDDIARDINRIVTIARNSNHPSRQLDDKIHQLRCVLHTVRNAQHELSQLRY